MVNSIDCTARFGKAHTSLPEELRDRIVLSRRSAEGCKETAALKVTKRPNGLYNSEIEEVWNNQGSIELTAQSI